MPNLFLKGKWLRNNKIKVYVFKNILLGNYRTKNVIIYTKACKEL